MKSFLLVSLLLYTVLAIASRPCGSNGICNINSDFIKERRERDDYSVHKDSHYMFVDEKVYHDLVSLHLTYLGGGRPAAPFNPNKGSIDQLSDHEKVTKEILEKSLSTSLGEEADILYNNRNNYFVVYGVVDLINLEYSIEHPEQAPWFFSAQEIIDHLQEDQLHDIGEVFRYVDQNGLCLENEYKNGVCNVRYYIESFDKVNEWTNQGVYEALYEKPLYVEVGLNQKYFQFYHPDCEHPVHAGNGEGPTYAGVLTGFQLSSESVEEDWTPTGFEYWEMYIRRHGHGYNRVRLNCTFQKWDKSTKPAQLVWNQPFAGLSSKMYRVVVPKQIPIARIEDHKPASNFFTNNELIEAIEKEIEDNNDPESKVDTSTVILSSSYLDCKNIKYNLTSINGISNIIVDDLRCVIDTTGAVTYNDNDTVNKIRKLQDTTQDTTQASDSEIVKISFTGLQNREINIGAGSFTDKPYELTFDNNNQLAVIKIAPNALTMSQRLVIGNNPNLQTIHIDTDALSQDDYMTKYPELFKNSTFVLYNLPALETLDFEAGCMKNIHTVRLYNVDMIEEDYHIMDTNNRGFNNLREYRPEGIVHPGIDAYFNVLRNKEIRCFDYKIISSFTSEHNKWGYEILNEDNSVIYEWQAPGTQQDATNPYKFTDLQELCAKSITVKTNGYYPGSVVGNNVLIQKEIEYNEYETVMYVTPDRQRINHETFPTEQTLYLDYPVLTKASLWKYQKEQPTSADWIETAANATFASFSETSPFKYFGQIFTVEKELTDIVSMMLSVRFEYGCVVLMNGVEVQRWNVTGDLDNLALVEGAESTPQFFQVTLPLSLTQGETKTDLLKMGENSIEVILVNGANTVNVNFDCSIRLIHNNDLNNRVISKHEVNRVQTTTSLTSDFFDNVFSYFTGDHFTPANTEMVFSYVNKKREWINAVSIYNGDQATSSPLPALKIEAKNSEDEEWTLLKNIPSIGFTKQYEKKTYDIENQKAYNLFKLSFNVPSKYSLSEIVLFQKMSNDSE